MVFSYQKEKRPFSASLKLSLKGKRTFLTHTHTYFLSRETSSAIKLYSVV